MRETAKGRRAGTALIVLCALALSAALVAAVATMCAQAGTGPRKFHPEANAPGMVGVRA